MGILVTVVVVGVLLASLDRLYSVALRVASRLATAEPADATARRDEGSVVDMSAQWSLFSRPFIAHRLAALDRELERLEHDPDVFAKAFHTLAARSAYEALAADARRLADTLDPSYADGGRGRGMEFELLGPSAGRREELDV
jgi:hypothetical protein